MRIPIFVIYFLFALSLVILAALAVFSLDRYRDYVQYTEDVEKTYRVLNSITTLETLLKDAETGNRGYLLTSDSAFLEPLETATKEMKDVYLQVRKLTAASQDQQQRIAYLNILIQDMLTSMWHTRMMFLYNKEAYHHNMRLAKEKMDACREMLSEMKQQEVATLRSRDKSKHFYQARAPEFLIGLFSFTALALIVSFVVIVRELSAKRSYQQKLERNLIELRQSNAELEQIAYISSHDLQEPLRKISTFTDHLIVKHAEMLNSNGRQMLARLSKAALRMRGLVEDLASYTSLVQFTEERHSVDVAGIATEAARELELATPDKIVQLFCDSIPVVKGFPHQLHSAFRALIDNSIKFSQPGVMPRVHIYGNAATADDIRAFELPISVQFIKVTIRDNGIGFENEFSERMFMLFQRLHTEEAGFDGKGIGLAIVKRVMANHNGYVFAKRFVSQGAEFNLFFPE